jgi:hypothetical protein
MCINNDYYGNKLCTFIFQNIFVLIQCNSILNLIVSDTAYYSTKMAGPGATFANMLASSPQQ